MPVALAVIVADPDPVELTGTDALAMLEPKLTVAGTVATPGLLELTLTVRPPAGAGAFRVSVRLCVKTPLKVKLPGEKDMLVGPAPPPPEPTCTVRLTVSRPYALAL